MCVCVYNSASLFRILEYALLSTHKLRLSLRFHEIMQSPTHRSNIKSLTPTLPFYKPAQNRPSLGPSRFGHEPEIYKSLFYRDKAVSKVTRGAYWSEASMKTKIRRRRGFYEEWPFDKWHFHVVCARLPSFDGRRNEYEEGDMLNLRV